MGILIKLVAVILFMTISKEVYAQEIRPVDEEILEFKTVDLGRGIDLGDYQISNDASKMNFAYHVNADLNDLTKISGFEFSYSSALKHGWWDFFVERTALTYDQVTTNNDNLGVSTEELEISSSPVLLIGTGLSYRTSYIQNFINSPNYFETIGAAITYVSYDETFRGDKFVGYGLKANFGIHKRTSQSFHFGLKSTYNLATVKRPAQEELETSSKRSLVLQWMTMAFDVGYYF